MNRTSRPYLYLWCEVRMLPNSTLEEGSVRVFLVVFVIPFEADFLELKKVSAVYFFTFSPNWTTGSFRVHFIFLSSTDDVGLVSCIILILSSCLLVDISELSIYSWCAKQVKDTSHISKLDLNILYRTSRCWCTVEPCPVVNSRMSLYIAHLSMAEPIVLHDELWEWRAALGLLYSPLVG